MAVQALNFAKDQLLFAGKVAVLLKGTSDDYSPIPGYLYKEINDISYQSPVHCQFLLEFLVKRMDHNSCHVKYKTLRLMKHVVENGEPTFRLGLRRMSDSIQEATKFGGPPDPVHGNLPYQVVRKIAKELCQILFNTDQDTRIQSEEAQTSVAAERIVGIGPADSVRGGKYQGFGNSSVSKKSVGTVIREGLEKLAEQLGESPAQRQAALLAQLENSAGDYVPPVISPAAVPCQPVTLDKDKELLSMKKVIPKHIPGRAGGGWEDDDINQAQVLEVQSEGSSELSERLEAASTPDWSAEEQLVTDHLLLHDKSQFFLLRPSQLKAFKKKCQSLNCEKIVEFISKRMQSSDEYVAVRAMLLLETFLLRNEAPSLDFIVRVCSQQLNDIAHHSTDQRIKDKARKIIRGLECYSSHSTILTSPDGQC